MKKTTVTVALAIAAFAAGAWLTPKFLRKLDMQGMKPVTVAKGLEFAWSLAFLPDGRMLVTERPGRMRIVAADGTLGPALSGLPPVWAKGEGGLMDVALDPAFAANGTIYWTFSEPSADGAAASTAVARGKLEGNALTGVRVVYRQSEKVDDPRHFGSRLLFTPEGHLLVTLGDRSRRDDAQKPGSAHGKILRITTEGAPAPGNPLPAPALPEVFTLGHRNVQGIAWQPGTGALWATEHGPQGGDELNLIRPGANYGWPVITYGCEYTTCAKIGEGTAKAGMEQPVVWWGPQSNGPSGMTFLTSQRYPGWEGQLFIGTLVDRALVRIKLDAGGKVIEQQKLITGLQERIRDVRQGPDGWLYVLTGGADSRIVRVEK